jgi:signal transduction histidine kinase
MSRVLPRTLRGRLILIILLALAVAQSISLLLFVDERNTAIRTALALEAAGRSANVALLLESSPPETHRGILRAATSPLVQFRVDDAAAVEHSGHTGRLRIKRRILALLNDDDPRDIRVELHAVNGPARRMPGASQNMARMHNQMNAAQMSAVEMKISIRLRTGGWLNVSTRFHAPPYQWAWKEAATFSVTAALLAVVLWLALGRIIRPLRRLAAGVDRFGRGEPAQDLPSEGPEELRHVTAAFNDMQARIMRFVNERTRLLGALGHDLRSPLTALRVRVEMVDDAETRERMIATIAEMQDMVEATLAFARGMSDSEPAKTVLLAEFLQGLVGDIAETGGEARFDGAPDVSLRIRPTALRRAIRNLIENALRYGTRARVRGDARPGRVEIVIEDDGPGIPQDSLERVFDPFVRLETSRSRETGGTGLGLSIARTIVLAHGGEITLENHSGGGLRVVVALPAEIGNEAEKP